MTVSMEAPGSEQDGF